MAPFSQCGLYRLGHQSLTSAIKTSNNVMDVVEVFPCQLLVIPYHL